MEDPRKEPLCFVSKKTDGSFSAILALPTGGEYPWALNFPVRYGEMEGVQMVDKSYRMKSWGLRRIGPHTWAVNPSIHEPGIVHAYIVLCEVPEPAPWEVTNA